MTPLKGRVAITTPTSTSEPATAARMVFSHPYVEAPHDPTPADGDRPTPPRDALFREPAHPAREHAATA